MPAVQPAPIFCTTPMLAHGRSIIPSEGYGAEQASDAAEEK